MKACRLPLTPYTLHFTPYTLHLTPYTLHFAPYTIHHTPCRAHHTPYTIHLTSYTTRLTQGLPGGGAQARGKWGLLTAPIALTGRGAPGARDAGCSISVSGGRSTFLVMRTADSSLPPESAVAGFFSKKTIMYAVRCSPNFFLPLRFSGGKSAPPFPLLAFVAVQGSTDVHRSQQRGEWRALPPDLLPRPAVASAMREHPVVPALLTVTSIAHFWGELELCSAKCGGPARRAP